MITMQQVFILLPTKMISKSSIKDIKIDYESYLTELLNASEYFMRLTGGEKFKRITEQDNGQADVNTSNYELDFKLLVNKEFMNNKLKALPKVDYSNIKEGFICVNDKTLTDKELTQEQANGLFIRFLQHLAALNQKNLEAYSTNNQSVLYNVIDLIKTQKNLFIFLPCIINSVNEGFIARIVKIFFTVLFGLRDNINKDTFIAVLGADNYFYIFKYENHKFFVVDKVNKIFATEFNYIYSRTYFTEKILLQSIKKAQNP